MTHTTVQLDLFTIKRVGDGRYDIRPHFAEPADVPRLTGQNGAILARLRQGPASNVELAAISLKYTGRISEIRAWLEYNTNETIACVRGANGLTRYEIKSQSVKPASG